MTKFGIGVGEEFPVDDARPGEPAAPQTEGGPSRGHGHGRRHSIAHLATRLVFLALTIAGIVWLLGPHPIAAWHGPYAFAPYHHHFFFPVFPVLLIALIVFAFRHRRHHHRHWHGHSRHHHGGEA